MAKKWLIGLFCAILGGSFLVFNVFSKQLSGDNHENRLLTTLPSVLQGPLSGLIARLDSFFVDNSPFRYQLTARDAGLDYILFGTTQSDQVLTGRDGWLFYKDGPDAAHPVANYQGLPSTFDSEETLAAAAASLQRLGDTLAARGCTLVLDLAPSKDRVYREQMPAGYPIVNEENRTDRLAAYLAEHTTVPVNWSYGAVRAQALADPDTLLYFTPDTHGNPAGALFGLDGARAARRLVREDGSVPIADRRTRKEMPADLEEIEAALDEGVRIVELCAPEEVLADRGRVSGLRCRRMRLVPDPDGGRPRPVPTDEAFTLDADTLIVSIGQRVKAGFLPDGMTLKADPHTSQTSLPNVFAGGDAVRGASTLINAIADGRHAAETILARLGLSAQAATATPSDERRPDLDGLRIRQATRVMGPALPERSPEGRLDFDPAIRTLTEEEAMDESRRCLQCDLVCNVCTTVCPNRANVALPSLPMPHPVQVAVRDGDGVRVETLSNRRLGQSYQIVNIADACNECGNCATFCPSAGAPYRDKPRIHLSRESFGNAPDGYRLASPSRLEGKRGGRAFSLTTEEGGFVFESDAIIAHIDGGTLCATKVILSGDVNEAALSGAVEAVILFRLLARKQPFAGPKRK